MFQEKENQRERLSFRFASQKIVDLLYVKLLRSFYEHFHELLLLKIVEKNLFSDEI